MPENPYDFGLFYYNTFVSPFFEIAKDTYILGFSLFSWFLGLILLGLAVRFFREFFNTDDK